MLCRRWSSGHTAGLKRARQHMIGAAAGGDIAIVLRIAAAGGCAEDREIARVRERLAGLGRPR
jgi:hypothetical protein